MDNVESQVIPERGGKQGYTVEFVSPAGDIVSVFMPNGDESDLNRLNAETRARQVMAEIAGMDASQLRDVTDKPASERLSARHSGDTGELEDQLQEGLEGSFPASDPVSATSSTVSGSGPSSNAA
ncbi:hypothetical protein [Rhizobium sp. G21]|uniref:hypothetical protein n=1 Tax=Rhizobium sp. G21 TaxID=2758439 RepID=UPI001600D113|nr:hypothetical protein [Rhizobium sp. G21]MBB1248215.1 hypothetical protein [Rhizobium sp. G21]